MIEDDKRYLQMRVARLESGMAWAEDPPSRTRHLIGNLVVEPRDNGEVQAKTAFLVYRSHLETDQQLFAGSREDSCAWSTAPGRWRGAPSSSTPTSSSTRTSACSLIDGGSGAPKPPGARRAPGHPGRSSIIGAAGRGPSHLGA